MMRVEVNNTGATQYKCTNCLTVQAAMPPVACPACRCSIWDTVPERPSPLWKVQPEAEPDFRTLLAESLRFVPNSVSWIYDRALLADFVRRAREALGPGAPLQLDGSLPDVIEIGSRR